MLTSTPDSMAAQTMETAPILHPPTNWYTCQ